MKFQRDYNKFWYFKRIDEDRKNMIGFEEGFSEKGFNACGVFELDLKIEMQTMAFLEKDCAYIVRSLLT